MPRINVTKTFLPPQSEYEEYLKQIWENGWLTNQGPLLNDFETKLEAHLGLDDVHFVANGTLALQLALTALGNKGGEIITTPFSYVATTSAILWEGYEPVYVDIDPKTLCLDPSKLEAAITDKTKAILAVHVFGNVCDIEAIEAIAKKHNLTVIYDGAHAFGVKYKGKSVFTYGDISTCSFHATKVFHTIEGGMVVVDGKELNNKVELVKRFGHDADDHFMPGINAKASEFQAAMGLCNLKYVSANLAKRKQITELYDTLLDGKFQTPVFNKGATRNYAYYPIILSSEKKLQQAVKVLESHDIYPRRYFYPSLNTLSYLEGKQSCPVSESVAKRILCLPLYADLKKSDVDKISKIVLEI